MELTVHTKAVLTQKPLTVFFRKEGWIDIGGNSWAPEKHFDIRYSIKTALLRVVLSLNGVLGKKS